MTRCASEVYEVALMPNSFFRRCLGGFLLFAMHPAHTQPLGSLRCERAAEPQFSLVLVNPVSSGNQVAGVLRKLYGSQLHLAALVGGIVPAALASWRPQDFDQIIPVGELSGSAGYTASAKDLLDAERVLRGMPNLQGLWWVSEDAVEMAAIFGERLRDLNLPSNGVNPSHRNKSLAKRRLAELFPHRKMARNFDAQSVEEILAWESQHNFFARVGKIVLKAPMSAGGQGIAFCKNAQEVARAFDSIYRQPDLLGNLSPYVLVEEYIPFEKEYAANFFIRTLASGERVLRMTDIYQYEKQESAVGGKIYHVDTLLDYHAPEHAALVARLEAYVRDVAEALDIREGWVHPEFILGLDDELYFGEANVRPMGSGYPRLSQLAMADAMGPFEIGIQGFMNLPAFRARAPGYRLRGHVAQMTVASFEAGRVFTQQRVPEILAIPGVESVNWNFAEGAPAPLTTDLISALGKVSFHVWDAQALPRAIQQVHELLKQGILYR